jgi:uncharacterized membrane protein YhaH (DUF805 family)
LQAGDEVLRILVNWVGPQRWFRGRSTRGEWWVSQFQFLILSSIAATGGTAVAVLVGAWLGARTIALTTRRLHDLGYSGWWQILGVGSVAALFFSEGTNTTYSVSNSLLGSIAVFICILYCIFLGFLPGPGKPNVYGEYAPT